MNSKNKKIYSKKTKTLMTYETDSEETVRQSSSCDFHIEPECNNHTHVNCSQNFSTSSNEPRCRCQDSINLRGCNVDRFTPNIEKKATCQRVPVCRLFRNISTNAQENSPQKLNPTPNRRLKTSSAIETCCCCTQREEYEYSCQPVIDIKISDISFACWKFFFNIFIGIFFILKHFITTDWLNYGTIKPDSPIEHDKLSNNCKCCPKTTNKRSPEPKSSIKLKKISQKTCDCCTQNEMVKLDSECLKLLSRLESPKKEVIHRSCQTKLCIFGEFDENCTHQFRSKISKKTAKTQSTQTKNQVKCERRRSPPKVWHSESSEMSSTDGYPIKRKLDTSTNQLFPHCFLEYKDKYTQTIKLNTISENFGDSASYNALKLKTCSCNLPNKCSVSFKKSDHSGPPHDCDRSLLYSNNTEKQYHTRAEYEFTNRKKSVIIQAFESEESGNEKSVKYITETRTSMHSSEKSHKVPNLFQEHSKNPFKLKKCSCNSQNKCCISSKKLHPNMEEHANFSDDSNEPLVNINETDNCCQKKTGCDFTNQKKSVIIQTFESEESGNEASVNIIRETRTSMHRSEQLHQVSNYLPEPSQNKTLACNEKKLEHNLQTSYFLENLQHSLDQFSSAIHMFVQSNQVPPPPPLMCTEVTQIHSNRNNDVSLGSLKQNEHFGLSNKTDAAGISKNEQHSSHQNVFNTDRFAINTAETTTCLSQNNNTKIQAIFDPSRLNPPSTVGINTSSHTFAPMTTSILNNEVNLNDYTENQLGSFLTNQSPEPWSQLSTQHDSLFKDANMKDNLQNSTEKSTVEPKKREALDILLKMIEDDPNKKITEIMRRPEQNVEVLEISNMILPYERSKNAIQKPTVPSMIIDTVESNQIAVIDQQEKVDPKAINDPERSIENNTEIGENVSDTSINSKKEENRVATDQSALDVIIDMMKNDPDKDIRKLMKPPSPEELASSESFKLITPYKKINNNEEYYSNFDVNETDDCPSAEIGEFQNLNPVQELETNTNIDYTLQCKQSLSRTSSLHSIPNLIRPAGFDDASTDNKNNEDPNSKKYAPTLSVIIEEDEEYDAFENTNSLQRKKILCARCNVSEESTNTVLQSEEKKSEQTTSNEEYINSTERYMKKYFLRMMGEDELDNVEKCDVSERDYTIKKAVLENRVEENNSTIVTCNVSEKHVKPEIQSEEKKSEPIISNEKNVNSTENYMKKYFYRMMGEDELHHMNKCNVSERDYTIKKAVSDNRVKENNSTIAIRSVPKENVNVGLQSKDKKFEPSSSNVRNVTTTKNYMKEYFFREMGEYEMYRINKLAVSKRNNAIKKALSENRIKESTSNTPSCNVSEGNVKTALQSEEKKSEPPISYTNSTENYTKNQFFSKMGEDELNILNKCGGVSKSDYSMKESVLENKIKENNSTIVTQNLSTKNVETALQSEENKSEPSSSNLKNMNVTKNYTKKNVLSMINEYELNTVNICDVSKRNNSTKKEVLDNSVKENNSNIDSKNTKGSTKTITQQRSCDSDLGLNSTQTEKIELFDEIAVSEKNKIKDTQNHNGSEILTKGLDNTGESIDKNKGCNTQIETLDEKLPLTNKELTLNSTYSGKYSESDKREFQESQQTIVLDKITCITPSISDNGSSVTDNSISHSVINDNFENNKGHLLININNNSDNKGMEQVFGGTQQRSFDSNLGLKSNRASKTELFDEIAVDEKKKIKYTQNHEGSEMLIKALDKTGESIDKNKGCNTQIETLDEKLPPTNKELTLNSTYSGKYSESDKREFQESQQTIVLDKITCITPSIYDNGSSVTDNSISHSVIKDNFENNNEHLLININNNSDNKGMEQVFGGTQQRSFDSNLGLKSNRALKIELFDEIAVDEKNKIEDTQNHEGSEMLIKALDKTGESIDKNKGCNTQNEKLDEKLPPTNKELTLNSTYSGKYSESDKREFQESQQTIVLNKFMCITPSISDNGSSVTDNSISPSVIKDNFDNNNERLLNNINNNTDNKGSSKTTLTSEEQVTGGTQQRSFDSNVGFNSVQAANTDLFDEIAVDKKNKIKDTQNHEGSEILTKDLDKTGESIDKNKGCNTQIETLDEKLPPTNKELTLNSSYSGQYSESDKREFQESQQTIVLNKITCITPSISDNGSSVTDNSISPSVINDNFENNKGHLFININNNSDNNGMEQVFGGTQQRSFDSNLGLKSNRASKTELFDEIAVDKKNKIKDTQNHEGSEILSKDLDKTGESIDKNKGCNTQIEKLDKKLPPTTKELTLNSSYSGQYSESDKREFQESQQTIVLNKITCITPSISDNGSSVTDNSISPSVINDNFENNNEHLPNNINNSDNKVIGQEDDLKRNICELVDESNSGLLCSRTTSQVNNTNSNNSQFFKSSQVKELTDYYNCYTKIHDENQNKPVAKSEDIIPHKYVKTSINRFENLCTEHVADNSSCDFDFTAADANCKSIKSAIITGNQETTDKSKLDLYKTDLADKEDFSLKYEVNSNCFPNKMPLDTENALHSFVNLSLVKTASEEQNCSMMLSDRISEGSNGNNEDNIALPSREEICVQDYVNKEKAIDCMPNSDECLEQEYEDPDFMMDIAKSGCKAIQENIQDDRSEIELTYDENPAELEHIKGEIISLNDNHLTVQENVSVLHDIRLQKENCWLDKVCQEEIPKSCFFTSPGYNENVYEEVLNISDDNENVNNKGETHRLEISEEHFQSECVIHELVSKVSIALKNILPKPDSECEERKNTNSTFLEHVIDKNICLNDKSSTIPTNITVQHNLYSQEQCRSDNYFQEDPSLFSTEYASVPADSNMEGGFLNSENIKSKFIQETAQTIGIECNEKCFKSNYDVNKPFVSNDNLVPRNISYLPDSEDEIEKEQLETECKEELESEFKNYNISLKKIQSNEAIKSITSENSESVKNQYCKEENVYCLESVESEFIREEQLYSKQLLSCHSLVEQKIQFEEECKTKNDTSGNNGVLHSSELNETMSDCPENNFNDVINIEPKSQLGKDLPHPTTNSSLQGQPDKKDEFLNILDSDFHTLKVFGSEGEYSYTKPNRQIGKDLPCPDNNSRCQEETCEIEEEDEFLKLLVGDRRTQQMFGSEYAALMKEMYDTKESKCVRQIENEYHTYNKAFSLSEHKKNDGVDKIKPQTTVNHLDNEVSERKCETKLKESTQMKYDSAQEKVLNTCKEGCIEDKLHLLEVNPTVQTKEVKKLVLAYKEKSHEITKQYESNEETGTEILNRELSSSKNEEEICLISRKIYQQDKEVNINRKPSGNSEETCITDIMKDKHNEDISEVIIEGLSNEASLSRRSVSDNTKLISEQIQSQLIPDTQNLSNNSIISKIVETLSLPEVNEIPIDNNHSTKTSSFDTSLIKDKLKIKETFHQEQSFEATNSKSCNEAPINQASVHKNEVSVTETVDNKLLGENSSVYQKSPAGYEEPIITYKASEIYTSELLKSKQPLDKEGITNDTVDKPSSSQEVNENLSANDCSKNLTKNFELLDEKSCVIQKSLTGYVEPIFTYKASQLYINELIKSRQSHDEDLSTDSLHSETGKFCRGSQNFTSSGKLTAEESLPLSKEENSFTNMTNQDKKNLNTINEQCKDSNCIDCLDLQQNQLNESIPGYRESIAELSNAYLKNIFNFKIQYEKTDYKPPTEPKLKRMSRRQLRKSIINSMSVHVQIDFSDIQHLIHQYENSHVHGVPKKEEENMFYKQKKIKSQIGKRSLYSQTSMNNLSKFQHRLSNSKANLLKTPSRMSTTQVSRPASKANLLKKASRTSTTQVLPPGSNTNLLRTPSRISNKKISQHASPSKLDLSSKNTKQLKRSPSICRQPRRNVRQCKVSSKHALSTNKDKYSKPINSIPYTQSSISCNLNDSMNFKIGGNPYPELKFQFVPVIAERVDPYDGEIIPSDTDSDDKFPVKPARRIIKKYSSSKKCLVYEEENLRPEMLLPKRTNSVLLGITISKSNLSRQSSMLSVLPRTESSHNSVAGMSEINRPSNTGMLSRVSSENNMAGSIAIMKDLPKKSSKSVLEKSLKHQLPANCLSLSRQSSKSSLPRKTSSRHQLPSDSQGLSGPSSRSVQLKRTASSNQMPSDTLGLSRQSSRSSLVQQPIPMHQLPSYSQGLPRQSSRTCLPQKTSSRHQLPSDSQGLPGPSNRSAQLKRTASSHQMPSDTLGLSRQSSRSSLPRKTSSRHQLPSDSQGLSGPSSRSIQLKRTASSNQMPSDTLGLSRQSSRSSLVQQSIPIHQLPSDSQGLPRQSSRTCLPRKTSSRHQLPSDSQGLPGPSTRSAQLKRTASSNQMPSNTLGLSRQSSRSSLVQQPIPMHQLQSYSQVLYRQSSKSSLLKKTSSRHQLPSDSQSLPGPSSRSAQLKRTASSHQMPSDTLGLSRQSSRSSLVQKSVPRHQLPSDSQGLPRQGSKTSLSQKTISRHQLPSDSQSLPEPSSRSAQLKRTASSHQMPSDTLGLSRQSSRSSLVQKSVPRHQLPSDSQGLPRQGSKTSLPQKTSSRHQLPSDSQGLARQCSNSSLLQKSRSRHQLPSGRN